MRCPKCGAFMEDGKNVCLMCGVDVTTYIPESNMGGNKFNGDSAFGSGNDFRSPNTSSYSPMGNNNNNRFNDYRKADYSPVKNEDKDIFDKYQENKKLINTILILVLIGIIAFAGFKYFEHKNKPVVLEPKFQSLYFVVDEGFEAVKGNSQGQVTYIKSGSKGNACSISITSGASTSGNHVKDYFKARKDALEPELDSSGKVVNELDVYTAQEGDFKLNSSDWYYLNIFYKATASSKDATVLKYKYLTSLYKGYYYDIELVNNSNDASCSASLDNFASSLKFVEKE